MSDQTPTPDYEAARRALRAYDQSMVKSSLDADKIVDAALEGLVVVAADEPLYRESKDCYLDEDAICMAHGGIFGNCPATVLPVVLVYPKEEP